MNTAPGRVRHVQARSMFPAVAVLPVLPVEIENIAKLSAPYRNLLRHYLFTRPRHQLESLVQKELLVMS